MGRNVSLDPAAAVMVAALGFSISSARSDQYPVLNVAPLCHALTDRSSLQQGIRDVSFDDCMKAEQNDRQTMINEWSTFSADDRRHCVSEATMGGEWARDVRKLHSEAANSSPPAQQVPQAPAGHR
jgi:hypothetical protein